MFFHEHLEDLSFDMGCQAWEILERLGSYSYPSLSVTSVDVPELAESVGPLMDALAHMFEK